MAVYKTEGFSPNQLRILWYLKRRGGVMTNDHPKAGKAGSGTGILDVIAGQLDLRKSTVSSVLRQLEARSLVLRTHIRPTAFGDNQGPNLMVRLELVDPDMYLPPLPPPLPLAVVVAQENEEMEERVMQRTESVPTVEAIVEALLNRITELQQQVDVMHGIIERQQEEADKAKRREQREREVPGRLTSRVQDALPAEVWQRLTHGGQ